MRPHTKANTFLATVAILAVEPSMAAGFYLTQIGTPMSIGTVGVTNAANTWALTLHGPSQPDGELKGRYSRCNRFQYAGAQDRV